MCLYPKLVRNPKYKANKKNGGVIPPIVDDRVKFVPIGCQRCMECKKKKARDWTVRLQEEIAARTNGKFVTMTFSDKSITELAGTETCKELSGYELDNEIATVAVRRFLERWRKKYKVSLRHWLVTELGHRGTENIHLHGIVWTDESIEEVEKYWQYGFMDKYYKKNNYVNVRTISYIAKYITKNDIRHKEYAAKILTSAGIGGKYVERIDSERNKYKGKETDEAFRTRSGSKLGLPIYYRNKIYTEKEREELWLMKLDKNERWVCGEKVKADNTKEYEKLLKYWRERSKELGYGDDERDWNREVYEQQRRQLLMAKRKERYESSDDRLKSSPLRSERVKK